MRSAIVCERRGLPSLRGAERQPKFSPPSSKYPPAEPGALFVLAAQSGLSGVASAAPVGLRQLFGGGSLPQFELIQPLVFLFLVADVTCPEKPNQLKLEFSRSLSGRTER